MLNLTAVVLLLLAVAAMHIGGDWLVRNRLPAWFKIGVLLTTFAAALSIAWYHYDRPRSMVRREINRLNDGRCPECGYDLRASPARCPECGTKNMAEISN